MGSIWNAESKGIEDIVAGLYDFLISVVDIVVDGDTTSLGAANKGAQSRNGNGVTKTPCFTHAR